MSAFEKLKYYETIRLDRDQLETLLVKFGPSGADKMVSQALEDLAVGLANLEKQHAANRTDHVLKEIRQLIAVAQQVGMTTLARVARDVLDLANSSDTNAYHAVMARLIRIGESSLIAVWDIQDMSI